MEYTLFPEIVAKNVFPSTRYQGSKAKYVDWIWHYMSRLKFDTALDAFGGTGSVAYRMKDEGKSVTYNDIQPFNAIIGKALIENNDVRLDDVDMRFLLTKHADVSYPTFIQDTFRDIYYTDEENHWLDIVRYNISNLKDEFKRALAWFALFQACIIKRPYNLFHRRNLYVRMSDVNRSFGNKKTWDTPFEAHFRNFVKEANRAVFDNGKSCKAINKDALSIADSYDLVYIDTPYLNSKGVGVDYSDFYHFLNGMVDYDNWKAMIDFGSKHLRLKRNYSIWNDKDCISDGFRSLAHNFSNSILVFSYRSNGIPSIEELLSLLSDRHNKVYHSTDMKYALSNQKSQEVLIISSPC